MATSEIYILNQHVSFTQMYLSIKCYISAVQLFMNLLQFAYDVLQSLCIWRPPRKTVVHI